MTEDEMAGWHHRLDGYEFGWTPGVGDGQGGLSCCSSWGRKESDMTERLNNSPGQGCWVHIWSELDHFLQVPGCSLQSPDCGSEAEGTQGHSD